MREAGDVGGWLSGQAAAGLACEGGLRRGSDKAGTALLRGLWVLGHRWGACAALLARESGGGGGGDAVGEGVWDGGEFADFFPEGGEVAVYVAGETVGEFAGEFRVFHDDVFEGEVVMVEGVDELAHVFDAFAERCAVGFEA